MPLHRPVRRVPAAAALLLPIGALAGMAALAERRARQAERRNPPIGNLLDLDGARLHYIAAGRGRPVLMIHGVGSLVQDFVLSIMPAAAERWRAVAVDRPGYGYSTRPREHEWTPRRQAALIARACHRLGLRDAVVVGHSWGCLVAMALALDHPEVVGGLVLISGYYYPDRRAGRTGVTIGGAPAVADLAARTVLPLVLPGFLGRLSRVNFAPNPVPAPFAAAFPRELLMRPSHIRATSRDLGRLSAATAQMAGLYQFVRQPVAVLVGAEDRVTDPRLQSMRLAAEIPRASLRILPDTGHMLHHIHPEAVIAAIEGVTRRMAPATATTV